MTSYTLSLYQIQLVSSIITKCFKILLHIIFIMLRIEDCSLHVLVSDLTTYPAYIQIKSIWS